METPDLNGIADKLQGAVTGGALGAMLLYGRGAWAWWRKRRERLEAEINERADEISTVRVAEINAETESEARLWARIHDIEARYDNQETRHAGEMRVLQEQMRVIQHAANNAEQKALTSQYIIDRQAEEVARLENEVSERDRQIETLQRQVAELTRRIGQLERR